MNKHSQPSEYAGQTVRIRNDATHPQVSVFGSSAFIVEDWWDRVADISWMNAKGNPAALVYAVRSAFQAYNVPIDDEVLYGKIGELGHLVHVLEIVVNSDGDEKGGVA